MTSKNTMAKGAKAEELLRHYFLELGFYATRALPVTFHDQSVTDVDLWLYGRISSLARHRVIVDVKNKKKPQAIERIFWTCGLRDILGVDQCIVATTTKQAAVIEYGKRHGVLVLDGGFINSLGDRIQLDDRITEEELSTAIDRGGLGKVGGDWKTMVDASKSRLLSNLDYDGINLWIQDIKYFAQQTLSMQQYREVALRLVYLSISQMLIAIDYCLSSMPFESIESRASTLASGVRYGNEGPDRVAALIRILKSIPTAGNPTLTTALNAITDNIREGSAAVDSEILAEYATSKGAASKLFAMAREFEQLAYATNVQGPSSLMAESKAAIGALLDFVRIDRTRFFSIEPVSANQMG